VPRADLGISKYCLHIVARCGKRAGNEFCFLEQFETETMERVELKSGIDEMRARVEEIRDWL
jgi:hypothetical protein